VPDELKGFQELSWEAEEWNHSSEGFDQRVVELAWKLLEDER
jgi:hypothetical protein